MRIRRIMEAGALALPGETAADAALALLRDRKTACIVVVGVEGGPGIVTAEQLERAGPSPALATLACIPVARVGPDDTIDVARSVLHESECDFLPVMEGDEIVGVISDVAVAREMELLRKHRIFSGLDQDAIAKLLRIARLREVPAGTFLLEEGQRDSSLIILDQGLFEVHTRQAGLVARVRPGEVVGELEISGGRNAASVRAAEESRVLVIERDSLLRLLEEEPRLGSVVYANISNLLGERLRNANRFVFLRGFARHRMLVIKVLAGVGLFLVLFTFGFGVASESPDFCTSCHYMRPYYDSWAASSHREIRCIKCHYSYGMKGVMRGKVTGLAMLTRYATRTYDPKPEAEVADESCLRSGCHVRELPALPMHSAPGIRYTHDAHSDSTGIGAQLRCTSCHQHGRQSAHFSVSQEVCFLCHLAGKSRIAAADQCRACHDLNAIASESRQIDHARLPDSMGCLSCHESVLVEASPVEEFRCFSCHLEPRSVGSQQLHRIHIEDREVDCFECHANVRHEGGSGLVLARNCESCHPEQHAAQEQVYLGQGGRDVMQTPGVMSFFHVECSGCHLTGTPVAGAPTAPESHRKASPSGEQCEACHDVGIQDQLRMWRSTIDRTIIETQALLERTQAVLSGRSDEEDPLALRARALFQDASYNFALVRSDNSRGVHNFKFTRDLLASTREKLEHALRLLEGG